jgi:hypothetical protein
LATEELRCGRTGKPVDLPETLAVR